MDLWNSLPWSKTAWDHCFKPCIDKKYKLDKRFWNFPFEIHAPGNFVSGEGDRIVAKKKKKVCEALKPFLNILQDANLKLIDAELKVDQCSLGIIQKYCLASC